ncbi:MAG: hypothetical protein ACI9NI_000540 [Olleya marilimosa]|jgi:hypothetical protein|uniref:Uncharacterized protein n=1 Tax=Olleya marilimosa TaxID=272164 RepID=A0ABR8LS40_9FLAO|nr:hypothetical protein [Olleya marilimosa]MBD3863023.1 hypothetical protein [Olleya marilimosa]MBD3890521.1 hypothetical protein [Olleya marilimosa]|tara:strand:- start:371831 stop:372253 length:423 start_codon:yes stop_codon:yes gene_type:complete
MKQIISKYLTLIILLLFSGVINVFANSTLDNNFTLISTSKSETTNPVSIDDISSQSAHFSIFNNQDNQLIFDYTESEEAENEESVTNTTINSFGSYIAAFLNAQLLSDLSSQLQAEANHYKQTFCQPSTKLHIRLEVFII